MIALADAEAQLVLFAEGIAGRYYHIKSTVEFAGRRTQLDPEVAALTRDTVYLPESLPYPDSAGYRVLALEQLGYREFGTFEFSITAARRIVPALGALPLPDPGMRDSDFSILYHHVPFPALLQRLHACCERARVLACLLDRYPGLIRHRLAFAPYRAADVSLAESVLGSALDALDRFVDGIEAAQLLITPAAEGLLGQLITTLEAHCTRDSSVYDACAAALACYGLCEPFVVELAGEAETVAADATPLDWMQRDARLEDWDEALAQLDNRLQVDALDADEVEAGTAENLEDGDLRTTDLDIRALANERDNLSRKLDMERSAIRDALGAENPLARSYRYDEWDYLGHRYLRHHCRLFEEQLAADADTSVEELKRVIQQHAPAVLKRFEQIKPLGYQRVQKVADGDELDLNMLIEARQDVRAGISPDERVYSRRERVHRDVCAAFLVDLSASTDDPVEPPEPPTYLADPDGAPNLRDPYDDDILSLVHEVAPEGPRRRIIDVQRESMLVMATALEHLGDSYGIYGFSGYGRDCVEFFVAKEPEDAFTAATLEAIASMSPKRSTRMGPAIRHATNKLVATGHAMKLLIILSDGFPQDSDYGPERGNHDYGLEDTAKALEESLAKGVDTFCVTVDRSGHDYLKRMCPDARYLVIEEIEELPEALSKVYQTLAGR